MAYKVVNEDREAITSCRMPMSTIGIFYSLNLWVKPPVGLALVFKTLKDALSFCKEYPFRYDIIYRCQTKGLEEVSLLLGMSDSFVSFWKDRLEGHVLGEVVTYNTIPTPKGTYGAEAVKLTKRLGYAHELNK